MSGRGGDGENVFRGHHHMSRPWIDKYADDVKVADERARRASEAATVTATAKEAITR